MDTAQALWQAWQTWLLDGHVTLVLSLIWTAYGLLVAVWILLERRAPLATLSWLLAMMALPVVGLLVYFIFGPRRFQRQRLKRLRSRRKWRMRRSLARLRDKVPQAPPQLQQLVRLASAASLPLSTAQRVELLVGGADTLDAIVRAVSRAQHHVHLEYYIFEPDTTGQRLLAALTERAAAGVQVRLLVDALGSKRLGRRHYQALLDAGGEVALFHPPRLGLGRRMRPVINFRTHRKIVVVDGVLGFTGGVNITDQEDKRQNPRAYHDIHIQLQGPVVGWLQHLFLEDWAYALDYRHHSLPDDFEYLLPVQHNGSYVAQIMASGPDSSLEAIHRVLVSAIHVAQQRLWLATPYFVPTEAAMLALTNAALRGVDVRVLVPRHCDSLLVTAAARSYFDELLECGVKVFEYQGRMLHAKTMVVDDMLGMVGTANFDNRSFRLNYEVCALVYNVLFTQQLAQQFEQDLLHARPVAYGRAKPFLHRLAEAVARLFSPLL